MEPGPGGDPIRNPGVLPTGKNIHALDPQAIPTQAAVKSARIVVERCARHCMLWQLCLLGLCWMQHALSKSVLVMHVYPHIDFAWCIGWPCQVDSLCHHAGCWRCKRRRMATSGRRQSQWCCGARTTSRRMASPWRRCVAKNPLRDVAALKPNQCAVASDPPGAREQCPPSARYIEPHCTYTVVGASGSPLLPTQTTTSHGQVMMMVGVAPVADALGRVNKLQVIPLEELGRPRVDVVVNCSGVFRDLFVNQMNLLDRAIKMAAEQDEPEDMNFVRKHAREQARRPRPRLQGSCMSQRCGEMRCLKALQHRLSTRRMFLRTAGVPLYSCHYFLVARRMTLEGSGHNVPSASPDMRRRGARRPRSAG